MVKKYGPYPQYVSSKSLGNGVTELTNTRTGIKNYKVDARGVEKHFGKNYKSALAFAKKILSRPVLPTGPKLADWRTALKEATVEFNKVFKPKGYWSRPTFLEKYRKKYNLSRRALDKVSIVIDRLAKGMNNYENPKIIEALDKFKVTFKNKIPGRGELLEFSNKIGINRTQLLAAAKKEGINMKIPIKPEGQVRREVGKWRRGIQGRTSSRSVEEGFQAAKRFSDTDLAHRLSKKQVDLWKKQFTTTSVGIDDPFINQVLVKPTENQLEKIYRKQAKLIKKVGKARTVPTSIQKSLQDLNVQVTDLVEKSNRRIMGVMIDEKTLKPRFYGENFARAVDAGVYAGTPLKDLTKTQRAFIETNIMPEVIKAEKAGVAQEISSMRHLYDTPDKAKKLIKTAEVNRPDLIPKLEKLVNQESLKTTGRIACQAGCLAKVATERPGLITKAFDKAGPILSTLGKFGAKAAPLAAVAALGAVAEPLVKQFRNDDYSTYLSDPEQQGSMLLAMVEQETPKVDEEILKWQMPAHGAATLAGAVPGAGALYKQRRAIRPDKLIGPMQKGVGPTRAALGLSGVLGKALGASFSPLAVGATLPLTVAAQRSGGTDWKDIATDPSNWFGPAFAASGADFATKGMKSTGILAKAIRMGMSPGALRMGSRFLGMPGLALTAGMWGYDKYKNWGKDSDDEFKVRTYKDDDD